MVWRGNAAGRLVGVAFIPTAFAPFQVWKGNAAEKPVGVAFIPSLGRKRHAWDENNPAAGRQDCLILRSGIGLHERALALPDPAVWHRLCTGGHLLICSYSRASVCAVRTSALPNPEGGHWLCVVGRWDRLILWFGIEFCVGGSFGQGHESAQSGGEPARSGGEPAQWGREGRGW